MRRIVFFILLTSAAIAASCGGAKDPDGPNGDTPTAAYKRLFEAVKSKNIEAIKAQLTRRTIEQARSAARQWQKSEESVLEHGMVASTMADTLPEIRDERIKDNNGAIEVWNAHDNQWEDLPFVVEDGRFKLALGELFSGSFRWPGKGRSSVERQANLKIPEVNAQPVNKSNTVNRK